MHLLQCNISSRVIFFFFDPSISKKKMSKATTVKRSSIPIIRESMLEQGALLFKFDQPSEGSSQQEHITWFNQMQELGFRVTTTGCFLPYENFKGSSKARPKGHKVATFFFKGIPSTYPSHPHGWPVVVQVSHLCHRKTCVNPNHIVYEPQWKNLKRNYCGENGSCDCGMTPACLGYLPQW